MNNEAKAKAKAKAWKKGIEASVRSFFLLSLYLLPCASVASSSSSPSSRL